MRHLVDVQTTKHGWETYVCLCQMRDGNAYQIPASEHTDGYAINLPQGSITICPRCCEIAVEQDTERAS